jgi:hypothetical protein
MVAKLKGRCVFIGEARQMVVVGKPPKVVQEFSFFCEMPKGPPEIVKVVSWNGFKPKLEESVEMLVKVGARLRKIGQEIRAETTLEVL